MDGIPVLSLFCGPGGLDLGFEEAGFRAGLALDNQEAAVDTYNWNRPTSKPAVLADLSATSPKEILKLWRERESDDAPWGIIGGPPCQSFSVSNVHRIADDPRSKLPLAYARILRLFRKELGVKFFVFENVAGLANRPHADSMTAFVDAFASAGFTVTYFFLDAVEFAVPQVRKRMFMVGFDSSEFATTAFSPPRGNGLRRTTRDAIGDLVDPVLFQRGVTPQELGLHPNHWCLYPKSPKFNNGKLKPGKMLGRSFRMLEWDQPSWTVAYGHREVHVHPEGRRRLSILEAMLLQAFPSTYELRGSLSDQIRLVSDAVPPPVARALAASVREVLASKEPELAKVQPALNGHARQLGLNGVHTTAPRSTRA